MDYYRFHPHPHGLTGGQVMAGLAGLFIVSDDEEAALNLPNGELDVPLVIQDRTFDADNRLVYIGQALTADGAASAANSGASGMGMGNSCRSQMAEAIIHADLGDTWAAFSAGTRPAGYVHPNALRALAEFGINFGGRSTSVDEFRGQAIDTVITMRASTP